MASNQRAAVLRRHWIPLAFVLLLGLVLAPRAPKLLARLVHPRAKHGQRITRNAGSPASLSYLTLPTPKGAGLGQAVWGVGEAKKEGWDGILIGLGNFADPDQIDLSGFDAVVRAAAKHRLRTHIRLLLPADANVETTGSALASVWATRYNSGIAWTQPYRPPRSVAIAVAKLVWQKAIDNAVQAYGAEGLKPADWISAEAANEPGIGGANGPALGRWSALRENYKRFKKEWKKYLDSKDPADYDRAHADFLGIFPESLWLGDKPSPEGRIEPEFFALLRSMLQSLNDRGVKIFPLTLEGESGATGQEEIDSCVGPDAQWIFRKYQGRAGFNAFMNTEVSSPEQAGEAYAKRVRDQVNRMRRNPLFSGELFNTEFGMENRSALLNDGLDIAEARQGILDRQRQLSEIAGAGFFISFGSNRLSTGFNLFDDNRAPVGEFAVGPNAP